MPQGEPSRSAGGAPLLSIDDLSIGFKSASGIAPVIDHLSLTIEAGRIVGLVGESGCGKSVTARAIMRLLAHATGPESTEGRILLDGDELLSLDDAGMRDVQGEPDRHGVSRSR